MRSLVVRAGDEPYVLAWGVVSGDAEGSERDVWTETPDGERLTEPERAYAKFLELQAHASMPAATTRIDEETIEIPAGRYECLRYTRVDGDTVDTFWFAKTEPGAPLRFEKSVGGEVVFSSMAIEVHGPSRL